MFKLELSLNHSLHAKVHVLDEVLLGATEAALVRNVKDAIACVRMLTMLTTDLHVELVSDSIKASHILHEIG